MSIWMNGKSLTLIWVWGWVIIPPVGLTLITQKRKYGENAKFYFMDTGTFIVHVKADDIYKDIAEDVKTRYDTSNYESGKPLPKGKNKKVIELMKDKLGRKIIKIFVGLRAKTYSYLIDDGSEDKKQKHKKVCRKKKT